MNYRKRFGKYEIRFGENGRAWRWFTTFENALDAFDEMAEEAEEFEDEGEEICLVESKTGEVIARVPTNRILMAKKYLAEMNKFCKIQTGFELSNEDVIGHLESEEFKERFGNVTILDLISER